MKKAIFFTIAILGMAHSFVLAQAITRESAPHVAALNVSHMPKIGHTQASLVGLVNPNGMPTAAWFEMDGKICGIHNGLTGHDAVPVVHILKGVEAGKFHTFRLHSINSLGHVQSEEMLFFAPTELESAIESPFFDNLNIAEPESVLRQISMLKGGDPKVLSVGASLAFFTSGVDSVAIYVNYVGSAGSGSGDQIGIQFGKATSSLLDSVETQFATAVAGQMIFDFKNLESTVQAGVQYNYRLFAFDGALGAITFYPGTSATYPITTAPAPAVSSMGSSTVSCITKVISYGPVYSNDQQTWIDGVVDTVPTFNSNYALMYGAIPQFSVGLINQMACTLNVAPYIVWDPNNISAKYYVKLRIRNSSSAIPVDSTIANTPCMLPAGVNNLENGESFTIFPNPVIDNATVKSTVRGILVIYDMQGRELLNQNILDEMTTINLGDFSQGIYNYCLFENGAPVVRDKIMVTK